MVGARARPHAHDDLADRRRRRCAGGAARARRPPAPQRHHLASGPAAPTPQRLVGLDRRRPRATHTNTVADRGLARAANRLAASRRTRHRSLARGRRQALDADADRTVLRLPARPPAQPERVPRHMGAPAQRVLERAPRVRRGARTGSRSTGEAAQACSTRSEPHDRTAASASTTAPSTCSQPTPPKAPPSRSPNATSACCLQTRSTPTTTTHQHLPNRSAART